MCASLVFGIGKPQKYDLKYKPGRELLTANVLSRVYIYISQIKVKQMMGLIYK